MDRWTFAYGDCRWMAACRPVLARAQDSPDCAASGAGDRAVKELTPQEALELNGFLVFTCDQAGGEIGDIAVTDNSYGLPTSVPDLTKMVIVGTLTQQEAEEANDRVGWATQVGRYHYKAVIE